MSILFIVLFLLKPVDHTNVLLDMNTMLTGRTGWMAGTIQCDGNICDVKFEHFDYAGTRHCSIDLQKSLSKETTRCLNTELRAK